MTAKPIGRRRLLLAAGSLGTAAPYGIGSVRYRDSRGHTNFTTTTMNGVTRIYDSGGHLTATVIGSRRR